MKLPIYQCNKDYFVIYNDKMYKAVFTKAYFRNIFDNPYRNYAYSDICAVGKFIEVDEQPIFYVKDIIINK